MAGNRDARFVKRYNSSSRSKAAPKPRMNVARSAEFLFSCLHSDQMSVFTFVITLHIFYGMSTQYMRVLISLTVLQDAKLWEGGDVWFSSRLSSFPILDLTMRIWKPRFGISVKGIREREMHNLKTLPSTQDIAKMAKWEFHEGSLCEPSGLPGRLQSIIPWDSAATELKTMKFSLKTTILFWWRGVKQRMLASLAKRSLKGSRRCKCMKNSFHFISILELAIKSRPHSIYNYPRRIFLVITLLRPGLASV